MDTFIKNQIQSFKNNKFDLEDLIKKYIDNNRFIILKIVNNKLDLKYIKHNDILQRRSLFIKTMEKTLENYKIKDSIIILYSCDGYSYNNDPILNYALPDNKLGFIFPAFDFIKWDNYNYTFNNVKKSFETYQPNKIMNDIYFKGGKSSLKRTQIREKLEKESFPFNINLSSNVFEEPFYMKKHKYLLDLPGVKPWSVRLKNLFMTESLVIRISFFDSKKGETSFWKQVPDAFFKENVDYIHLIYDVDYNNEIPPKIYNKIKQDIIRVYTYYENNPKEYNKIVKNMIKKSKKMTMNTIFKYIAKLINAQRCLFI